MDSTNPAAHTVTPVVPGFDPLSIRCAAETRLHDLIWKDEDLLGRLNECSQTDESKVDARLDLLTDGYRVDEALTPRLFRLGSLLTQVLRLAIPLDVRPAGRRDERLLSPVAQGQPPRAVPVLRDGQFLQFAGVVVLYGT